MAKSYDIIFLSLWGYSVLMLVCISLVLCFLHNLRCTKSASRRWGGRELSPVLKKMTDREHELFLYNINRTPYIGDDYLFPGGLWGLPKGMAEDFIRIVCNRHSVISVIFVDVNNSFQYSQKCALYVVTSSYGFLLYSFIALAVRYSRHPRAFRLLVNIFVASPSMVVSTEFYYILVACPCCVKFGRESHSHLRSCTYCIEIIFSFVLLLFAICFLLIGSALYASLAENLDDALDGIFWEYVISILIAAFLNELLSFGYMFVDIDNKSSKIASFFRVINIISCGFLKIGTWYKQRSASIPTVQGAAVVENPVQDTTSNTDNDTKDLDLVPVVVGAVEA